MSPQENSEDLASVSLQLDEEIAQPLLPKGANGSAHPCEKRERRRWDGLLLGIFASLATDATATAALTTAGFSGDWRRLFGLQASPKYPFGNSGLDIFVLALLRVTLVGLALSIDACRRPTAKGSSKLPQYAAAAMSFLTLPFLAAKSLCLLMLGPGNALPPRLLWPALLLAATIAFTEYKMTVLWCKRRARRRRLSSLNGGLWAGSSAVHPENDRDREDSSCAEEENSPLFEPKFRASYGDLLRLVQEDWHLLMAAFVALILAAVGQVFLPHFTGQMVDSVVENGPDREKHFVNATIHLVYAAIVAAVFTGLRGSVFTVIGARCNKRIRTRLLASLLQQEIGFFDITKTGDLSSRLSADTAKVGDQVTLNVNVFLRNFVQVVGTLAFMTWLSWRLTVVAFVSVPIVVLMSKYYGKYVERLAKATQDKLAEASTIAEAALGSMPTVRAFHAENAELKQYSCVMDDYCAINLKQGVAYGFYAGGTTLLPQLVTALVLWYGGRLVLDGELSGGGLVSFMLYLNTLSSAFNNLGDIYSALTQAIGAAHKVFYLIQRKPRIRRPINYAAVGEDCRGLVELNNVIFEYPARPGRRVLNGMSFEALPGQVVALVGSSGGGKSSCIALIQNFYHVCGGSVRLDGRLVEEYAPEWLHRHVSVVSQEPVLFGRSIKRNIKYGLEGTPHEPSDADVERAAKLARAHDFISMMPDKYDTDVGERGLQISGGQKQRIAIARSLVRKPRVLLLDEATASLDSESEHQVQLAIDGLMKEGKMTLIVIAHRLSTVRNADLIVCVDRGKVVESGRHEELVARNGVYARLVARQLGQAAAGGSSNTSCVAK